MNRVTKRTWLMGLFLAVLLGGMVVFAIEYVANAGTWITAPGSPHVYNRGNLGCGTVVDRSGNVLLDMTNGRTYSTDPQTRKSTLHWVGDRYGSISAGAVSKYSSALADMVAQPRAATVMGLLEEARLARLRGFKVAQKSGSMKTAFGRFKDFIVGNF